MKMKIQVDDAIPIPDLVPLVASVTMLVCTGTAIAMFITDNFWWGIVHTVVALWNFTITAIYVIETIEDRMADARTSALLRNREIDHI